MIPLIIAAAGAAGGALKQNAKNKQGKAIMDGIGDNRFGYKRQFGAEQDALINALRTSGAAQTMEQANVARTDLGRQLQQAQAQGGARAAMFTGGEADLAGSIGQAAGQESVGNQAEAGQVVGQAQQDALRRRALRLEALRMYKAAEDSRKSVVNGAVGGAANGLMGYYSGGG